MIRAFAFLIATSTRNKFVSQLKRLRHPRYALALLLGVGYFWLLFFNRSSRQGGVDATRAEFLDTFSTFLPLAVLAIAVYVWVFVKDRTALAFTPAEVSMLFAAPVSRRALILYKLARTQAAVLSTSIIWVFLINHGSRPVEHAISYWLMLSTISMHRLGVALVKTSQVEHGISGLRRSWPALLVVGLVVGSIAWGYFTNQSSFAAARELDAMRTTLMRVIAEPPVQWALYPFHALVGATFARTTAAWLAALPAAVVLFLFHILWILQSDAAFEEAAVEASAQRARLLANRRARGVSAETISKKAGKRTIKLSPTGAPAVALLWKNYLWLARTGQVRALIGLPVLLGVIALAVGHRNTIATVMVVVTCGAIAVMTVIFGPMTMRNDLRSELARLPILKTLPLRGREIMLAEVASSALPTAMMQCLLVFAGAIAVSLLPSKDVPSLDLRLGIVLGAPLGIIGLNMANFTIHNGMALLFPAWVKLGDTGVSGVEAMGQTMLTAIVTLVILAVLLIVPAIGGAIGYFTLRGFPILAMIAGGAAAGILLGLESYAMMNLLGGQLDRLEPMNVG